MGERIVFRKNDRLHTVNPRWRGNPTAGGRFFNRQHRWKPGVGSVLKWRFSPNPQRKEKKMIKWNPQVHFLHSLDHVVGNSLIWLGHNSFFLQLGGKRFMIDSVFDSIPFVRRRSRFPANVSAFQQIDYLLISHDHFDHLDKPSVARLVEMNPQMKLFCGIGTGALIKGWFPSMEVIEAAWYQQWKDEGLSLTFLPAQHWSKRGVSDGGERLWGAFMIEADGITIYNSGDTGYAHHFSELPEMFSHIDYCMVGIGAYKPRWFMKPNHISPYDALTASADMHAHVTIPMHYGTFDLSDEPLFDPPHVFAAEAKKRGMEILMPELGEIVKLKHQR
ncbi:MAG: MBL fold metallo-hydrolase [Bacteroides sp.]|nr:MBL fold metallo-hydrolase [Bacteroides sp.]MDD6909488.1 MBL fold metallo-hydrolase [Bacteroidaceae bacterium]